MCVIPPTIGPARVSRPRHARARFDAVLAELAGSTASLAPRDSAAALEAALNRAAAALEIDWVWRWAGEGAEDDAWDSTSLKTDEPARFGSAAELPQGIRQRLSDAGVVTCSALAVPFPVGTLPPRALFAVSRDPAFSWTPYAGRLRVLAALAAAIEGRTQAELALEAATHLNTAILDSMPSHIAVLDRDGVILTVNESWAAFVAANAVAPGPIIGPGESYLRTCREGVVGPREAVDLIERACRGERTDEEAVDYRADSQGASRWFRLTVKPLPRAEGGAVVAHRDITKWKTSELVLQEGDKLFRRTADALPLAIWMSDDEGRCTFFNKGWLHMTGRTFEEERCAGWLQSVHADERAACLDAYLRAFELRVAFRVEYRIQRQDGTYRWILDTGMPRYGNDGEFVGYVGGCVDISERKEAERMLRNLSHRLMRAQDQERRHIARELHDHLSQQLALLAIQLQHLATAPSPTAEALLPAIEEAWRRTTEIASDLHGISHRLHPSKMEALGLVATIQAHCRDVSRQSLPVIFHQQNVPADIPPDRALNVFRVLEEALSNVIRHSSATEAHVSLVGAASQMALRVADNGKGFTVAGPEKSGMGLISMRERLQLLGGSLSVKSVPGQGTVVEARIPSADRKDAKVPVAAHPARFEVVQVPARMTRRQGTVRRSSRTPRRTVDS